jgi:cytochrome c6
MLASLAVVLALSSVPAWGADAAKGKAVYAAKCQTCHAADGSGNPGIAKAMGVTMEPLGGPAVQKMSNDDLQSVISMGKGKMRPVTGLSAADVNNVVAYIRTLKK